MKVSSKKVYQDLSFLSDTIPLELRECAQWVKCYLYEESAQYGKEKTKTFKRPIGGASPNEYDTTFEEVITNLQETQLFGFKVRDEDGFFIMDLDLYEDFTPDILDGITAITHLPENVRDLLIKHPTYVEYSPSKKGLHIVYKTDKTHFKNRIAQPKETKGFTGSVFLRNQFITFTGCRFDAENTTTEIARVSAKELEDAILKPIVEKPHLYVVGGSKLGIQDVDYTFSEVRQWLMTIPTKLTPALANTYRDIFNRETNNYDHWQIMAAATHAACDPLGKNGDGAALFDEWSARDSSCYNGTDEAVQKYYDNPPKPESGITHRTLIKLANSLELVWPIQRTIKGVPYNSPVNTEIQNFIYMMEFHNITIEQNVVTKTFRIYGEKEIIKRYFSTYNKPIILDGDNAYNDRLSIEEIIHLCHFMAQSEGFSGLGYPTAVTHVKSWITAKNREYNEMKDWISEKPWDGKDRMTKLLDTLTLQTSNQSEAILHRSYIKKNLMGIIRAHYYEGAYGGTSGIVILQGGENTYKSTWVRQLLPDDMREKYLGVSQNEGKTIKELQIELGTYQILLYDEVQSILKNDDSVMKKFLNQEYDLYRPLYGGQAINTKRRTIFFGTTNKNKLPISKDGSRRIQVVKIKQCDTTAQALINLQQVYAQLLVEFKNTPVKDQPGLWNLNAEELIMTNESNEEFRVESDVETYVRGIWDFSTTFNNKDFESDKHIGVIKRVSDRLLSVNNVASTLAAKYGVHIKPSALIHVLMSLCGTWTSSTYDDRELFPTKGAKSDKKPPIYVKAGSVKSSNGMKVYLMPPKHVEEVEE